MGYKVIVKYAIFWERVINSIKFKSVTGAIRFVNGKPGSQIAWQLNHVVLNWLQVTSLLNNFSLKSTYFQEKTDPESKENDNIMQFNAAPEAVSSLGKW